jgi:hypothetical protein
MQRRKGIVYPVIVNELTDYAELQEVWDCDYQIAYHILHGHRPPTHRQKVMLSEYLGLPIEVIFAKAGSEDKGVAQIDTPEEQSLQNTEV